MINDSTNTSPLTKAAMLEDAATQERRRRADMGTTTEPPKDLGKLRKAYSPKDPVQQHVPTEDLGYAGSNIPPNFKYDKPEEVGPQDVGYDRGTFAQNTSDQDQTMSAPVGLPQTSDGGPAPDNGMGILKGFAAQANSTEAGAARQQGEATSAADLASTMELAAKNHLNILRAPIVADIADAAKENEEKIQKINSQAEASTRAQIQKVQDATDAAAQFQYKDFWASRSGFGTAMGILAQALGGAAGGAAKQPGAPTALDRVIAQDLEFQKLQYSKLQSNVSNQRSLYQDLVAQTGSELAAETAFYNAHITKFNAMLAQAAQQNASPQTLADAQAAIAANQQKASDKSMQLAQMHNENQKAILSGTLGLKESQDRLWAAHQAYLAAHPGKANRLAAMGITGVDMSEKEADLFKERVSAAKRADELAELLRNHPDSLQDKERIQEYKLAVARAKSPNTRAPTKAEIDAVNVPHGLFGSNIGVGFNAGVEARVGTAKNRYEQNAKDYWPALRAMVRGGNVTDKDLQEHTEPDKK